MIQPPYLTPMAVQGIALTAAILAIAGLAIYIIDAIARARGKTIGSVGAIYRSWLIIAPAYVIPLALGKIAFIVAVTIYACLCVREFYRAAGLWDDPGFRTVTLAAVVTLNFVAYFADVPLFHAFLAYFVAFALFVPVWRDRTEGMLQRVSVTCISIIYFGWFFAHLSLLYSPPGGQGCLLFLALLTELNDVLAFVSGKLFGRHLLAPRVSPKKTVEGTLGSMVGVLGLSLAFRFLVPDFPTWKVLAGAGVITLAGTLGDLVISVIKRDLHVKDMSQALAGHGGVLDRCDSIILAAPMFFHFVNWFSGR